MDEEEKPKTDDIKYILEAAPQKQISSDNKNSQEMKQDKPKDTSAIIFCLDHSGSMDGYSGGLSKMECVKKVVLRQMQQMTEFSPDRKMGVVAFSTDITIIGDGSQNPEVITES